jgi:hypothetical protein
VPSNAYRLALVAVGEGEVGVSLNGLGSDAIVAIKGSGTIIALLPADREDAEQTAQQLIHAIEATPLRMGGHRDSVTVKLACGIVTFSPTQAPALSVPAAG